MTHFYGHNRCGHSESQTELLAGTSSWDSCSLFSARFIFSRLFPPPGRDGGAAVRDAGDEGHVHGGRRLPAARTAAAAGAGRSWRQTWCLGGNRACPVCPRLSWNVSQQGIGQLIMCLNMQRSVTRVTFLMWPFNQTVNVFRASPSCSSWE